MKPCGIAQTLFAIAWLSTSACGGSEPTAASGEAAVGGHDAAPVPPPAQSPKAGSSATRSSSTMTTPSAASAGSSGAPTQAAAGASGTTAGATASAAGASGTGGASGSASASRAVRPQATTLKYPTMRESVKEAPYFNIYRPANLDEPGGLLPVVAWANGGCVREESNWRPLFDAWAAAGIVTLALTASPNGTLFDMTTKDEHKALIDWIAAQDKKAASPYAGKLDLTKIVTSGNSCGGVTALEVAAADKRVSAVFVLSGSSALGESDPAIMKEIKVPVAYVTGNPDEDVAAPNAQMDYDLLPEGVPAVLVNRSMGDHPTVSTDPTIVKQAAEMSLNFIDLVFFGTPRAADALQSPTVCTGCAMGEWKLKAKNLEKLRH